MDENVEASAGLSEYPIGPPIQETLMSCDETLESSSPPLLSPENQEVAQRPWNKGVRGSIRAPPMLLPMAEPATSQPTSQVQAEEVLTDQVQDKQVPTKVAIPVTSEKRENRRKKPKRMTPRRREIIIGFFLEVYENLRKYGNVGGPAWLNELLKRIRGEGGRFEYVQVPDVVNWLNLAEFKEDYENLLTLDKELQGTSSATSSATDQPLPNDEPIGFREPLQIAPPSFQPAPFATAAAATATSQVKIAQPEPASPSNLQGTVTDGQIIYQTQLPEHSTYFVNHLGLPILPNDLWQNLKEAENQSHQQQQPNLFFQPGGFLVQLPPSATATTLYIHPTSWAAYTGKCNEINGVTGTNGEVKLETVKQEKDKEQQLNKEKEDNCESDFAGDQFMGYMGEPTDAQE